MSNQISSEDLVWSLSTTELRIAYLALTLTPAEIGQQTGTLLVTVNNHLTEVYKTLGLRQPGQNRRLLKEQFGTIIEKIWVREVHQDSREYRRKQRARLEKNAETQQEEEELQTALEKETSGQVEAVEASIAGQTSEPEETEDFPAESISEKVVEVPRAESAPEHEAEAPTVTPSPTEIPLDQPPEGPTVTTQPTGEPTSTTQTPPPVEGRMYEPPPPARQRPWRDRIAGRVWFLVALLIVSGCCLFLVRSIPLTGFFRSAADESQTPAATELGATGASVEATADATATVTLTLAPTLTSTPEVLPTAVPLPIREDFSKPYSNLWRVLGSPILTENVYPTDWYSGVLTTRVGETGTLLIGNTAWVNYSVSFKGYGGGSSANVAIGVRVIDLNNMVVLDCRGWQICNWLIVYEGEQDVIAANTQFFFRDNATLTVDGDTFTAVAENPFGATDDTMSLVLPLEYQGKFTGGGVMVKVTDQISIDYVEIVSFP